MARVGLNYKNMMEMGATIAERKKTEAEAKRGHEQTMQTSRQTWEGGQNALQREWQGGQAALDRDWRSQEALAERDWRGEEAGKERTFKGGEEQKNRLANLYGDILQRAPGALNSPEFQSGLGPEADLALRRAGDPANRAATAGNWKPFTYTGPDGRETQMMVNGHTGEVRPINQPAGESPSSFNFKTMPEEDAYRFFQQLTPEQQEAYGYQLAKQDPEKFKRVKHALENEGRLPEERPNIGNDFQRAIEPGRPENRGKDLLNAAQHFTPFGGLIPRDLGLKPRVPDPRYKYIDGRDRR